MGLDLTHDCWHGSYSAFSRWRDKLAEVAGYTFHQMVESVIPGREFISGRLLVDLDWGNIERLIGYELLGNWPVIPVRPDGTPDPLIILLAHSDCDGLIRPEHCAPLADRLEELLPALGDQEGGGHIGLYRVKTEKFIAGLRKAAKRNQQVSFH